MMAVAKKAYFATVVGSAQSCPAGIFHVVCGILSSGPAEVEGEHSAAHCSNYFGGKIDLIRSEFDVGFRPDFWMERLV